MKATDYLGMRLGGPNCKVCSAHFKKQDEERFDSMIEAMKLIFSDEKKRIENNNSSAFIPKNIVKNNENEYVI